MAKEAPVVKVTSDTREAIAALDSLGPVLTVKFQVRMTPEERKMLEEITQRQWPGSENQQSHMLRRLIREKHAQQKQQER